MDLIFSTSDVVLWITIAVLFCLIVQLLTHEKTLRANASRAISESAQKSKFVAQVSHEMRTPLAAVLGCIDSLLINQPGGEVREVLRVVRSQGQMLKMLLNDVLDIAKIEAGKLTIKKQNMPLAALFADVCSLMEPLAQEKGISLSWRSETKLPVSISCDPDRLRQVLLNLIGNAIKFTNFGSVRVLASVSEIDDLGFLNIDVRDTGIGIPRARLGTVFEEFEQGANATQGAGLGLPIAQRLLSLMGGTISVRSEVDIGSAFTVTLPLGRCSEYSLEEIDQISVGRIRITRVNSTRQFFDLRVLAAEDTLAIQFVLRRLIGPIIQQFDLVSNGCDAVSQVMSHEGTSNSYDLVLLDVQMPEINGLEAASQLRREGFNKPIVAISAGAMEAQRELCLASGFTHFLARPIDYEVLIQLLDENAKNRSPTSPYTGGSELLRIDATRQHQTFPIIQCTT